MELKEVLTLSESIEGIYGPRITLQGATDKLADFLDACRELKEDAGLMQNKPNQFEFLQPSVETARAVAFQLSERLNIPVFFEKGGKQEGIIVSKPIAGIYGSRMTLEAKEKRSGFLAVCRELKADAGLMQNNENQFEFLQPSLETVKAVAFEVSEQLKVPVLFL